jgi:YVTN family beta-propeller protein
MHEEILIFTVITFEKGDINMIVDRKGTLYVPEAHFNQISAIDCLTCQLKFTIPVDDIPIMPLGSRPTVAISTRDEKKIYTCNFGIVPPTIGVVDLVTKHCSSIIISSLAWGVFIAPDDSELYLSLADRTVEVFDTETNKIVRKLAMPDIPLASIRDKTDNLYVCFASGKIGVFDVNTGSLRKDLICTGGNIPAWFSFSKNYKKIYVATMGGVGVIDIDNWKLIKVIKITSVGSTDEEMWGFTTTLSPNGQSIYVTLMGESRVLVIDTMSDEVTGSIKTSGTATGVTFNADGSTGYISDLGESLSFLNGPVGGAVLANTWIGSGMLGNGAILTFDPIENLQVGEPIETAPGPGIPVWISH